MSTPAAMETEPTFDLAGCLARVRRRDQEAARQLVEHLHPAVVRIVRGHLPRRTGEEDLCQEVFLKMFNRLEQYRGVVPFGHWVARIAYTTCVDHLRAQRLRPEFRWADLPAAQAEMLHEVLTDGNAMDAADALTARELVHTLLDRLPAEDRLVLRLRELEQKTFAEIARVTGWNLSVAKVRAFRARRRLQKLFRDLQQREEPRRRVPPAVAWAGVTPVLPRPAL